MISYEHIWYDFLIYDGEQQWFMDYTQKCVWPVTFFIWSDRHFVRVKNFRCEIGTSCQGSKEWDGVALDPVARRPNFIVVAANILGFKFFHVIELLRLEHY